MLLGASSANRRLVDGSGFQGSWFMVAELGAGIAVFAKSPASLLKDVPFLIETPLRPPNYPLIDPRYPLLRAIRALLNAFGGSAAKPEELYGHGASALILLRWACLFVRELPLPRTRATLNPETNHQSHLLPLDAA